MTRTITGLEFKANLDSILRGIAEEREPYVIEADGKPTAVLVSANEYAELKREWAWRVADQLRTQNNDRDPDEIYEEVTALVEEVRQERYDRWNSAKGSS